MRRKRQGAVSAMSFAAVLIAVELLARASAPTLPIDPGKWPRTEIAQKLDQMRTYANRGTEVQVIFAGSSLMAGGVDPAAFTRRSGISSYNAAFAGPSVRTVAVWVADIIEPLLSPDVVVLGVQSREVSDNGPKNERMYEVFLASPGYKQATSSLGSAIGGLEDISYFLRYRLAFREPSVLFEADSPSALAEARVRHEIGPRGRRNDTPGTFHRRKGLMSSLYQRTLVDFSVGGPEMEALAQLHRELEARGVELILLNMPVTEHYWDAHEDPSGDRATYRRALHKFVEEKGVTLIDAEKAFGSNDPFRDPMHLDVPARKLLARALASDWRRIVAKGGTFALACPHRGGSCTMHRTGSRSAEMPMAVAYAPRESLTTEHVERAVRRDVPRWIP